MNKDVPWLWFSCERDEYDGVRLDELERFTDIRPLGYSDLSDLLNRRKAPKHRKHTEQLLERYGCADKGHTRCFAAFKLRKVITKICV